MANKTFKYPKGEVRMIYQEKINGEWQTKTNRRKIIKPKIVKKKKHRIKSVNKDYKKALRRNRRGLQKNITKPEQIFKNYLDTLEIKYEFQRIFIAGKKGYIADFYLPDYLMVVEIDGNNHSEIEQDEKDHKRTEGLLRLQAIIHVLRFDNEEVLGMDVSDVRKILTLKICPFAELI